MKPIIMLFFLLLPIVVHPEQSQTSVIIDKKVICDEFDKMIEALTTKGYEEKVTWIGSDKLSNSKYSLLVNEKTGTWTILQYNKEAICIIGAGEKFKMLDISNPI